jgi:hypothetical protein
MLKGFLLTNITDTDKRTLANELWKQRTQSLREFGREDDFFKSWLRSQYAMTIRGKAKGITPGDFERIGSEFHRWVRQHADESGVDELVLVKSDDYLEFIQRDFNFYSNHYNRLTDASLRMVEGLEHIYYNARQGFTLQPMMLLAPLDPADSDEIAKSKQRLVAIYIDIVLTRRIWNYRTISQSSMHDSMFRVMREIRRQSPREVAERLYRQLANDDLSFASNDTLRLHQQNRYRLHQILARIADYVEVQSGNPSRFLEYVAETGKNRYEIEHI